jgi:hypothetical protein
MSIIVNILVLLGLTVIIFLLGILFWLWIEHLSQ